MIEIIELGGDNDVRVSENMKHVFTLKMVPN